ncbi:GAF domain-containing protein [Pigmentibacter sp. JX0631]|uniref:GAF domain-containing protein n=1 Tax=Pigmentibacter sp. JX0631 TaxID=2976982 RepID=UPI0024694317|nr:GAF domain-containing protein [Pigmentibacter sp. JX0631]WGL60315.1 GAF domain-containing protein [Pigmentibacter sp. JX0631]
MIHGKKKSFCNNSLSLLQERERVESLKSYFILDSLTDSNFDEIAYLAAKSFKCPYAMINFIDKDRIWSKSVVGNFPVEYEKSFSFCQYAIYSEDYFVIHNTLIDKRVALSPYVVQNPFIRFYAAVPLFSYDGHCVGTLAIFDTKENDFSEGQFQYLKYLASRVMNLMELRRKKVLLAKESRAVKLQIPKIGRETLIKHQTSSIESNALFSFGESNFNNSKIHSYIGSDVKSLNNIYSNESYNSSLALNLTPLFSDSDSVKCDFKSISTEPKFPENQVSLSSVIKYLQKIYRKKIKQKQFQLEFISHVTDNLMIETNSAMFFQLFISLIDYSIESFESSKYRWILFEFKENESELEIQFSYANCTFNFLFDYENKNYFQVAKESVNGRQDDRIVSNLENIINTLNGHCHLDRNLVNSKLTIYIGKNNRSLLN